MFRRISSMHPLIQTTSKMLGTDLLSPSFITAYVIISGALKLWRNTTMLAVSPTFWSKYATSICLEETIFSHLVLAQTFFTVMFSPWRDSNTFSFTGPSILVYRSIRALSTAIAIYTIRQGNIVSLT